MKQTRNKKNINKKRKRIKILDIILNFHMVVSLIQRNAETIDLRLFLRACRRFGIYEY